MKRGELTSSQIVLLILALAAFLILGLFLWSLRQAADGDAQACKLSVLTRVSLPEGVRNVAPLACTTEKICLTGRGGDCAESMAGESIETIKLSKDDVSAARTIEATAAEAMYRCWDMMGKGQLNFATSYLSSRALKPAEPLCIICSRIAIDSAVPQGVIEKVQFADYLRYTKVPGTSKTYLQAFSDSEVNAFPAISKELNQLENVSFNPQGGSQQFAIVFMQIVVTDWSEAAGKTLTDLFVGTSAGAGGSFYIAPVSTSLNAGRLISFIGKHFRVFSIGTIAVAGGVAATQYINTQASRELAAGYCGTYASTGSQKQGCSIVQAVPYDAREINKLCGGNIDGAP